MRTKVKICGITRLPDALAAVEAGADALGFMFFEGSKRHLTPAAATNSEKGSTSPSNTRPHASVRLSDSIRQALCVNFSKLRRHDFRQLANSFAVPSPKTYKLPIAFKVPALSKHF